MRTTPHPVRVVWKLAQIVLVLALMAFGLLALSSGARDDNGAQVLVPVAATALIAWLVLALTQKTAEGISPALRVWSGTATEFIARPPGQVWAFVRPAENAPAIQPTVRRAFRVPGTPDGPGEQQCFISEGPLGMLVASVVEVVEESPGYFASVRSVTGPPQRQHYEVRATGGGSTLTLTIELSAMRWATYSVHPKKQAGAAAATYVSAVKRLVECQAVG